MQSEDIEDGKMNVFRGGVGENSGWWWVLGSGRGEGANRIELEGDGEVGMVESLDGNVVCTECEVVQSGAIQAEDEASEQKVRLGGGRGDSSGGRGGQCKGSSRAKRGAVGVLHEIGWRRGENLCKEGCIGVQADGEEGLKADKGDWMRGGVTRVCVRGGGRATVGNELALSDGDGLGGGGCVSWRVDVIGEGGGEEGDEEGGVQMGVWMDGGVSGSGC